MDIEAWWLVARFLGYIVTRGAEGEMAGAEDILYAFLLSSISNLQFTIVFVISCLS